MNHTPGPWLLDTGDGGDPDVGLGPTPPFIYAEVPGHEGRNVEICTLREPHYRADSYELGDDFDPGDRWHGDTIANAALILAAPELFDLVSEASEGACFCGFMPSLIGGHDRCLRCRARAVLAKAKGETDPCSST